MPRSSTDPYTLRPVQRPRDGGAHIESLDALVGAAQGGSMEAWSRLYQANFDRIFRHVRFLVGHEVNTEDLVQEVFARALVALPEFDRRASFSTWLHGIAINVVRNHWRAQKSTATAHQRLSEINAVRGTPGDDVAGRHLCRRKMEVVYAILAELPEHLREAFVLRELEGFSPAEAAAQLGISPGNLAVRASRARDRIRKELVRLGWIAPSPDGGAP